VPQTRLSGIIHGRRAITADTGPRLSRALGLSDMFWINLQARYDADVARAERGAERDRIHPPHHCGLSEPAEHTPPRCGAFVPRMRVGRCFVCGPASATPDARGQLHHLGHHGRVQVRGADQ